MDLGVTDVAGLDGDYVDRNMLMIPEANFRPTDLRRRITMDRRFDLAISMEVAEHLPYHRSETFVRDLVALSDVVLFSAALPYQGGVDHINEQWLEFWAVLFQRYGYLPCDVFRRQFWGDHAVEFWYSQNLMVFCTKEHAAKTFPSEFLASGRPLSYPHPLTFLVNVARYRPLSARALDLECEGYQSVVHAYQNGDGTLPLLRVADATDEAGAPLFPRCRTLITDAQAEISARDAEAARLTGELEAARGEAAQEAQRGSARDLEAARLTGELEAARGEAAQRTEELEIGRQQNDRMSAELSGVREQTDRLLDELSHRRVEARQLTGELGDRQNQVRELSAEIDRLSHELTARNIEIRSLVSPLTARESEIARLKEELRARQEEFSHLSLALGAQVCEMRWRSERLTDKERALQEATAQVAARERELAALRNSLTWRATGPVRRWMRWLAGLGGEGRRTVRVLRSSGLFDQEYYLAQNPDVAAEGLDPIQHYVRSGAAEGRDPSRLFDTSAYMETHPELVTSGVNPLLHYVLYGDHDKHSQTSADQDRYSA
jgi:predicted  nucleic acid-binding Zn-ribbon protein